MAVSSYGSATKTSGVVRIVKDLDLDLTGRHVLLVEDIVDSGLTLSYVRKNLAVPEPGVARGVRPAGAQGPPEARPRPALRRLRHPVRLRDRLRPRRRRALPQPPVRLRVRGPRGRRYPDGSEEAPPLSRVLRPAGPAGGRGRRGPGPLRRQARRSCASTSSSRRWPPARCAPPPSPTATGRSPASWPTATSTRSTTSGTTPRSWARSCARPRTRPRSRSTTRRTRCGGPSSRPSCPSSCSSAPSSSS